MMRGVNRVWVLLALLLAMLGGCVEVATAQGPTTTVQDTVYTATGVPASGSVVVSWGTFTTAGGVSIPAGTTTATLGPGGALSMSLAPNAGGTPMGSYYTAVFHLSDGTTSKQYWVVPVVVPGGGPAKLAAIQNSVLPTSVAMQTVSKQYVDNAIAAAQISPIPLDASPYVLKAGDTMTGPLVLPADPVSPNQASDKHYVDVSIAGVTGGLGQTVHTAPSGTQTVVQPAGTQLGVNLLNGELYASQYVSGGGNNGIANATTSSDCASGCKVEVEPNYSAAEPVSLGSWPNAMVVEDQRGGADTQTVNNPLGPNVAINSARSVTQVNSMSQQQLAALRPGAQAIGAATEQLSMFAEAGGSNLFPQELETPPYFKSTYSVMLMEGFYNTQGQHVQLTNDVHCYGVGDCLAGSQFITSSGGYRDDADEGTHPYDLAVQEDVSVFQGTCTSGCTTGSTTVVVTATSGGGTQGEGRFLIDMNPAKVISTGAIVGGGRTIFGTAQFSGTSFPVSVFLATGQNATSQADNVAPGTVTLPIATSGVPTGFATSTAALPATTGVACVADLETLEPFPNYEMAPYTVVDATHLQLTLNKTHAAGAAVAVGGLCGYGLNQTVDDVGAIKQVFPVVGSTDATDLYYADAGVTVIGQAHSSGTTSAYENVSLGVASVTRTGGVVTLTTTSYIPEDINGLTLSVSGVADSSYNGSYVVTTTGAYTLTYSSSGPDSTSSGGTVAILTGGFNLYPMAEVLGVYNFASHAVDGTLNLAPNTVAWAAGDAVEQPHYHKQNTSADTEIVTQYTPRPLQYVQAGKYYNGNVTKGLRGWQVSNAQPASYYLGGGGTHNLPDDAYVVSGEWKNDFEVDAGSNAIVLAHCNIQGCSRWDSGYDLFQLDSAAGADTEHYEPESSTVSWIMQGQRYSFSPTAFTAGTINVGTLNATTITGGVSGGAITSGTVSAARLPVFGPSGTSHAAGIVPDPGATAGATRYLREDGTWSTPAGTGGSGGSPSGAAGGDLSGSYPSPTVNAVHATSGTLDGVSIGATTPAAGIFATAKANSYAPINSANQSIPVFQTYDDGTNYFGFGQNSAQVAVSAYYQSSPGIGSVGFYVDALPNNSGSVSTNTSHYFPNNGIAIRGGSTYCYSSSATNAGTSATSITALCDTGLSRSAAGVVSVDTTTIGNGAGGLKAATVIAGSSGPGFQEVLYTPSSSSATCTAGQFADDANYHYVCVAANTWKRVALSAF